MRSYFIMYVLFYNVDLLDLADAAFLLNGKMAKKGEIF